MNQTKTLREELTPLIPELDRALEVVGKAGEIIQRHTKEVEVSLKAVYFKSAYCEDRPEFYLKTSENDDVQFYPNANAIIAAAEAFKPVDPEEKKRQEIARLEAQLAKLKGEP